MIHLTLNTGHSAEHDLAMKRLYSTRGRAVCAWSLAMLVGAALWAVLIWSFLP